MTATGKIGQSFQRALKKGGPWTDMYPHLTDQMKTEFRASWSVQRNWEFTKETRTVTNTSSKSTEDLGEMLPEVSIAGAWVTEQRAAPADGGELLPASPPGWGQVSWLVSVVECPHIPNP